MEHLLISPRYFEIFTCAFCKKLDTVLNLNTCIFYISKCDSFDKKQHFPGRRLFVHKKALQGL